MVKAQKKTDKAKAAPEQPVVQDAKPTGESAPQKLTAQEKKVLDLYRKIQSDINTPPAPIVETVTPEEKELLTAYRTGEYLPMHQHMHKYREAAEFAFWRERLADYQPLKPFDNAAAEHDDGLPTELEYMALRIANRLTMNMWIPRQRLWGEFGNFSDLAAEIAESLLEGFREHRHDLHYLMHWLELEYKGLLPDATAKGGDDATTNE